MPIAKLTYHDPLFEPVWSALDTGHLEVVPPASRVDPLAIVVRTIGVDPDQLTAWLAADPFVTAAERLAELSDGWLYRCQLADHASVQSPLLQVIDDAVEFHRLRVTAEGWTVVLEVDHRNVLVRFLEFCEEQGIEIRSQTIHQDINREGLAVALTDEQYDALRMAVVHGYFAIPREYSIVALADQLDISKAAASDRIRRGLQTLMSQIFDETRLDD